MGNKVFGTALLWAVLIILCAAAPAMAYNIRVTTMNQTFDPGDHVKIEVAVQGLSRVNVIYPPELNFIPAANEGVSASLTDGTSTWNIRKPEAPLTLAFTVSLPQSHGKRYDLKLSGLTTDGKPVSREPIVHSIWTRRESFLATSVDQKRSESAPPTSQRELPQPVVQQSIADSGLLGKMRAHVSAAWLHEFESYKEKDVSLGYPRSFTNADGSIMTQLADSQWDFGVGGGYYRSPSLISKNQEVLASLGRNVWRVGPALRWRSNPRNSTVLQTVVGVNNGDRIEGTNLFSVSAQWDQKIGNVFLRSLGILGATASVLPKHYALQNTLKGTLNGALESWSIQEQVDVPLPVFNANGNISPLALSLGGTWNVIWDRGNKFPKKFRSTLDIYPWVGISYRFGPNNQSGLMAAGIKGDDYKDGGETPLGILTTGTLVLEGGDRQIKNVDMSAFEDED